MSEASASVKWAVTLFLGTIGIGYFFGVLMVTVWVGLTPAKVAEAYREPAPQPGAEIRERVRERPIDLEEELGTNSEHRIDTRLLIQDTHVHIPVYALIALVLAVIALGLRWPPRLELVVIFALFAGPILDFGGMWLTKFVADRFAYMTLAGGWLMAAAYVTVAGTALWQMWVSSYKRRRNR